MYLYVVCFFVFLKIERKVNIKTTCNETIRLTIRTCVHVYVVVKTWKKHAKIHRFRRVKKASSFRSVWNRNITRDVIERDDSDDSEKRASFVVEIRVEQIRVYDVRERIRRVTDPAVRRGVTGIEIYCICATAVTLRNFPRRSTRVLQAYAFWIIWSRRRRRRRRTPCICTCMRAARLFTIGPRKNIRRTKIGRKKKKLINNKYIHVTISRIDCVLYDIY